MIVKPAGDVEWALEVVDQLLEFVEFKVGRVESRVVHRVRRWSLQDGPPRGGSQCIGWDWLAEARSQFSQPVTSTLKKRIVVVDAKRRQNGAEFGS